MSNRLREPFGKAGLIVAIVALVAATVGGAYAANHGKRHHKKKNQAGLNAKQKKQVRNIAKTEAKKVGGKEGPAGPQGPKGDNGSNGSNGAKGDQGIQGPKGDTGNTGPKGDTGEAGMCSEANPECKLASGATLTGVWGTGGGTISFLPISFPIRVSPAPTALAPYSFAGLEMGAELEDGGYTIYGPHPSPGSLPEAEEDQDAYKAACPGSAAVPKAAGGFLCIYTKEEYEIYSFAESAPKSEAPNEFGIVAALELEPGAYARGSWAVTAE